MGYIFSMQTVAETSRYTSRAAKRLTAKERETVVNLIAADPECGVLIKETGGLRKVRVAARGKGKSGGVRVIYYYFSAIAPIYLLDVFGKGEKDNLTKAERNALAQVAKLIASTYGV